MKKQDEVATPAPASPSTPVVGNIPVIVSEVALSLGRPETTIVPAPMFQLKTLLI